MLVPMHARVVQVHIEDLQKSTCTSVQTLGEQRSKVSNPRLVSWDTDTLSIRLHNLFVLVFVTGASFTFVRSAIV